ncbi:uncharacterized protein PHACADRAFT_33471 [Phanerochaete carnosa HHB-10118-sp]|uniref:Uncharacterized protein n=1 Tax=Phanerochaete carnosa (strain HHB-10118-sp) TaxID=650164 RepID=K5VE62_PHACS|nr:uncharacterized protein PHACADRAFT_33471 [Phanerochaete carnosa HHB-10118-sp]EKM49413.1 hypothetical protein PHACADRAFT_33471 [Phanerochaete carnosa HHB-10118-sp]
MTEYSAQRIFLASELEHSDTSLDLTGICENDIDVSTTSGTSTMTLIGVCSQESLTAPPTQLYGLALPCLLVKLPRQWYTALRLPHSMGILNYSHSEDKYRLLRQMMPAYY